METELTGSLENRINFPLIVAVENLKILGARRLDIYCNIERSSTAFSGWIGRVSWRIHSLDEGGVWWSNPIVVCQVKV